MFKKCTVFYVTLTVNLLLQSTVCPMEQRVDIQVELQGYLQQETSSSATESSQSTQGQWFFNPTKKTYPTDRPNIASQLDSIHNITKLSVELKTITDDELATILAKVGNSLKDLTCIRCTILQNPIVTNLNLEALTFWECTSLETPTIKNCPKLTCLNLTDSPKLTDTKLAAILALCGCSLTTLQLNRCTALQDPITDIFRYCPKLKNLDLFQCTAISTEAMTKTPANCNLVTDRWFKRDKNGYVPIS